MPSREDLVLERIRDTPEGFVRAYGDVSPGAPRRRDGAGDHDPDLPWWRIMRADGSLAKGARQRDLLEAEAYRSAATASTCGWRGCPDRTEPGPLCCGRRRLRASMEDAVRRRRCDGGCGGVGCGAVSRRSGRPRSAPVRSTAFPMPGSPVAAPGDADLPPRDGARPDRHGRGQRLALRARTRGAAPAPRRRGRASSRAAVRGGRDRHRPHRARHPRRPRRRLHVHGARRPSPGLSEATARSLPPLPPARSTASAHGRTWRRRSCASTGARPRTEEPDLPRPVLAQGQPAPGRPADHRRPRRPRVVQAGPPRHGGHRPQGPGAPGEPGDHLVGGPLRDRLGLRRLQGVRPHYRQVASVRPLRTAPPTCTTCS